VRLPTFGLGPETHDQEVAEQHPWLCFLMHLGPGESELRTDPGGMRLRARSTAPVVSPASHSSSCSNGWQRYLACTSAPTNEPAACVERGRDRTLRRAGRYLMPSDASWRAPHGRYGTRHVQGYRALCLLLERIHGNSDRLHCAHSLLVP
jgi:hypothetical protein